MGGKSKNRSSKSKPSATLIVGILAAVSTVIGAGITAFAVFTSTQMEIHSRETAAAPSPTANLDAGHHSIYVSNITNPPHAAGVNDTTVWLTARGPHTYIVDSIRIMHIPVGLMAGGTGAVLPDADYEFTFGYESNELHALYPALRLSPTDSREVSFTLRLVPTGSVESLGGQVIARVFYHHTHDGVKGSLLLDEPSEDGVALSRLLETNIKVNPQYEEWSQVISPNGLQRGGAEGVGEAEDIIEYIPLAFPRSYVSSSELASLAVDPPEVDYVDERKTLNDAIIQQGKVPDILEKLSSGDSLAFDLCAGLIELEDCEHGLSEIGFSESLAETLAIRHVIQPSETLASFVLSNSRQVSSISKFVQNHLIVALMAHPTGQWYEALIVLAEPKSNGVSDHETACEALNLRRAELSQDQNRRAQEVCRR